MPRKAREKSYECLYHIICRSMPEFLLFRDNADKDRYLYLLKRYIDKFKCSIYAYCLMDNHLHLHFDPKGCDISKFMQCLNTAYVRYYNIRYSRYGAVFQDRFESRILDTDNYNFTVSAYIHNNAHDLQGFCGKEEAYPYSSYGIYLGLRKDIYNLVDKSFMMSLFNISSPQNFAKKYYEFVSHFRDTGNLKKLKSTLSTSLIREYISGRKIIVRELTPAKVMSYIADRLMVSKPGSLAAKSRRKLIQFRSFTAYTLRVLCGLGYREICETMCNLTISGCSRLCDQGYELLENDTIFSDIFNELVVCKM